MRWLLASQNGEGSFGSARNTMYTDYWPNAEAHRSYTAATTGLCVMALLRHGEPEETARAAAERATAWLVQNHDLRRCDDWDIDNVWGMLYALHGLAAAHAHPWFAESPQRAAMSAAIEKLLARVAAYQSPNGGWAYYADQIDGWRPQWATSFTTAAMIVALDAARAAGVALDETRVAAAVRAVERCRLPGGAFSYDVMAIPEPGSLESINDVRGSLCRIPVCNLALSIAGWPVRDAELVRGFDLLFAHHRFLDCALMRPTPHEAYHANSGYFYLFGHFYAGELLARLPAGARRAAAGKLAFEILKIQERSGACWDYWFSDYARTSGTAFAAMTLGRALEVVAAPGS
jgi:hypothetical protein